MKWKIVTTVTSRVAMVRIEINEEEGARWSFGRGQVNIRS